MYTLYITYTDYTLYMSNKVNNETTIRISKKTKELLDSIGKKPESYDDIVNRLAIEHRKRVKNNG
jgi:hypothetical protein